MGPRAVPCLRFGAQAYETEKKVCEAFDDFDSRHFLAVDAAGHALLEMNDMARWRLGLRESVFREHPSVVRNTAL